VPRQQSSHVDDPKAVGRRLRKAREAAGLSQRDLEFPGCTAAYISRIEVGARVPSLQLLRELARRVGVSEDYLATGRRGDASAAIADGELALRLDDVAGAKETFEAALAEAPENAVRSRALEGLGHVALRESEPRRAVELFEEALRAGGGEPMTRPQLAEGLARGYGTLGELAPAIALLEQGTSHFEQVEDVPQYTRFAALLAAALTDSGDFSGAERVLANALGRARAVVDPYARARLYWSQSRLLTEQGKVELAERYAQRALETLRVTEDTYAIAHAMELLATIRLELGNAAEALELVEEGWPLIEGTGTPVDVAHFRLVEARARAALGQKEEAAELALELADQLTGSEAAAGAHAHFLLGEIFADIGEGGRAREFYELAIRAYEEHGETRHVMQAYERLASLLKEEGRRDEALDLLERALKIQTRSGRRLS
jgi:tetratricopeptide (TPR) repeat protein